MLFRRADLAAIAAGEITVAFRRWRRPMARAGGTQQTPAGVLAFDAVERVDDVTDADARRAGLPDADAVRALLRGREGDLYRIRFHVAGPDPRIALRAAADLTAEERAAIAERLAPAGPREPPRRLDGGDPARDRGIARRPRRGPGRGVRARAAEVQDRRAQAEGPRADREPRRRLPALAARPGVPRRLTHPRRRGLPASVRDRGTGRRPRAGSRSGRARGRCTARAGGAAERGGGAPARRRALARPRGRAPRARRRRAPRAGRDAGPARRPAGQVRGRAAERG